MYYVTFLAFAFVIAIVPFSVAVSSSVFRCIEWKEALKISFVFALVHAVMAAAGWGLGTGIKGWFRDLAVPVALFIMAFIAFRYFADSFRKGRELRTIVAENRRILLGFSFVTGINTLLLSISLGMLFQGLADFLWILASMVFILTIAGIRAGKLGWMSIGRRMETVGGLMLFGIALFILLQYLQVINFNS